MADLTTSGGYARSAPVSAPTSAPESGAGPSYEAPWSNASAAEAIAEAPSGPWSHDTLDAVPAGDPILLDVAAIVEASPPAARGDMLRAHFAGLGSAPLERQGAVLAAVQRLCGDDEADAFRRWLTSPAAQDPYVRAMELDGTPIQRGGLGVIADVVSSVGGPRVSGFAKGLMLGAGATLDEATVGKLTARLGAAGAMTAVFPAFFVRGLVYGSAAIVQDTFHTLAHLDEVVAALAALGRAVMGPGGEDVAHALGVELGTQLGTELASVAESPLSEVAAWMGEQAAGIVVDVLAGLLLGAAVGAGRRLVALAGRYASELPELAVLVRRLEAMGPSPLLAGGGPDVIPDRVDRVPYEPNARVRDLHPDEHFDRRPGRDGPEPADDASYGTRVIEGPREAKRAGMRGTEANVWPDAPVEEVFSDLMADRGSLGAWADALRVLGIADEAMVRAALARYLGSLRRPVQRSTVLQHVKDRWRAELLDALCEGPPEASHARMAEITESLNNSDAASLQEQWYRRVQAGGSGSRGTIEGRRANTGRPDADKMLGDRKPDWVDAETLLEVKGHRGPLDEHSIAQIDDYVRGVVRPDGVPVTVGGEVRTARRLVIVFIREEGLRANAGPVRRWLDAGGGSVDVEWFDSTGAKGRIDSTAVLDALVTQ